MKLGTGLHVERI